MPAPSETPEPSGKPVLVLQMQRMGDLILSFPLLLWLARKYPGRPLWVCAERIFYEPLMGIGPRAVYIPWEGADFLRRHEYEAVLNLSIREEAARLAGEVRADRKLGPALAPARDARRILGDWQLYRASVVHNNRHNRFHWADLNALDAVPLADMAATRFDAPRNLGPGRARVGLFLGASEPSKRPDAAFWAALVREMLGRGLRPALFGGPAEVEAGREVERLAGGKILNYCGRLGLDELAAAGQTLHLFVTPDTGPMHLAAWTGTRVLNLSVGNVSPWETGPYQPGHYVLRADIPCAPGCWTCTRDEILCRAPFTPKAVAFLAARLCRSAEADGTDRLARSALPGLRLFRTGRDADGLYHLERVDPGPDSADDLLGAFWKAFFGAAFGLWGPDRAAAPLDALSAHPEGAAALAELRAALPGLGRAFTHGLRTGAPLAPDFWSAAPLPLRAFTGHAHMLLANDDYAPAAWARAVDLFDRLHRAVA